MYLFDGDLQGGSAQLEEALTLVAACGARNEPSPWSLALAVHVAPSSPLPTTLKAYCSGGGAAAATAFAQSVCSRAAAALAANADGASASADAESSALWRFNLRPPVASSASGDQAALAAPRQSSAVLGFAIASLIILVIVAAACGCAARWALRRRASALAHLAAGTGGRSSLHTPRERRLKPRGLMTNLRGDESDDETSSDESVDDAAPGGGLRLSRVDPKLIAGLTAGGSTESGSGRGGSASGSGSGSGGQSDSQSASQSWSGSEGGHPSAASNKASAQAMQRRSDGYSDDQSGSGSGGDSASGSGSTPVDTAAMRRKRPSFVGKITTAFGAALKGAAIGGQQSGVAARQQQQRRRSSARGSQVDGRALRKLDALDDAIERRLSTAPPGALRR